MDCPGRRGNPRWCLKNVGQIVAEGCDGPDPATGRRFSGFRGWKSANGEDRRAGDIDANLIGGFGLNQREKVEARGRLVCEASEAPYPVGAEGTFP